MRRELGDKYVTGLFSLYSGRVPASADLVCYWFARALPPTIFREERRTGFLATQSIRSGSSRSVLDQIKAQGDIFLAWSDRPWVLDGAAVRVSMIGFDGGFERMRTLDGTPVEIIYSDLKSTIDLTRSGKLRENRDLCFRCGEKGGPFEINERIATEMLAAPLNPNGRPNSDVVRPYIIAMDITGRQRNEWIIDFGVDTSEEEAALYEKPFEYLVQHVKPVREQGSDNKLRQYWWLHRRTSPDMRNAVAPLGRFIVTPRVAKHRLFVFLEQPALPDSRLAAIARDDDYFFGVLHSRIHEVWSLATSSRHGDGDEGGRPTYNITTCFETFPFPWPPGQEPTDDPHLEAIAEAAQELVEKRDAWLNPSGMADADLKKRTLTNLYNARPTWLDLVHKKLDAAVAAAYGWPADLPDDEILARLLALNLERAGQVA